MARHSAGHLFGDYGVQFHRWNWHRSRARREPSLLRIKSRSATISDALARQAGSPSHHAGPAIGRRLPLRRDRRGV